LSFRGRTLCTTSVTSHNTFAKNLYEFKVKLNVNVNNNRIFRY
jgi:hypothetical protein